MIEVLISESCLRRLKKELRMAGAREMGGVMGAENLGNGRFRITAMSFQRNGGSVASFVRDPMLHRRFIRRFMARTGNLPERFNYFGEWHSHPGFVALPSGTDIAQMQQLIRAKEQIANFLVLLIVKLNSSSVIEASAHAFRRAYAPIQVGLVAQETAGLQELMGESRMAFKETRALKRERSNFLGGFIR